MRRGKKRSRPYHGLSAGRKIPQFSGERPNTARILQLCHLFVLNFKGPKFSRGSCAIYFQTKAEYLAYDIQGKIAIFLSECWSAKTRL